MITTVIQSQNFIWNSDSKTTDSIWDKIVELQNIQKTKNYLREMKREIVESKFTISGAIPEMVANTNKQI